MEGNNSCSITVITKDTTIESISSWSVKNSSITFCGYYAENYLKKISSYRINNLRDLEKKKNQEAFKIDNYPKPDTLQIPFKSIQKIKYSKPQVDISETNEEESPPRFGVEMNGRENELTLALLTEDVGKGGKMIYTIILGLPLLLTNAEHYLFLLKARGLENTEPVSLSTFISFRTDYFDRKRVVYTPGVGVQIEYNWGNDIEFLFGNSLGLKIGTEFPDPGSEKPVHWRIFLAVKTTF